MYFGMAVRLHVNACAVECCSLDMFKLNVPHQETDCKDGQMAY